VSAYRARYHPFSRKQAGSSNRSAPLEELTLQGFVTDLHREDLADRGRSRSPPSSRIGFRKVRVALEAADYDLAISAHRERLPVFCEGDLVREGKGYVLRNMRRFGIQREED